MRNGRSTPVQLTFLWEEPPAKVSALQDSEKGLPTPVETSCLPILQSLTVYGLDGLSGKMCPVSCRVAEGGILEPSSGRWGSWGMGGPTGSWTLNGAEHTGTLEPFRSADGVCSLSDVLETAEVPQRFYLSAKACSGILRRAGARGKVLPPLLEVALKLVIQNPSS